MLIKVFWVLQNIQLLNPVFITFLLLRYDFER